MVHPSAYALARGNFCAILENREISYFFLKAHNSYLILSGQTKAHACSTKRYEVCARGGGGVYELPAGFKGRCISDISDSWTNATLPFTVLVIFSCSANEEK